MELLMNSKCLYYIIRVSSILSDYSERIRRKRFAKRTMRSKLHYGRPNKVEQNAISMYWGGVNVDSQAINMYNRIFEGDKFDVRFIPDDIYYCNIDLFYNNFRAAKALDDKNFYDLLFPDVTKPATVIRKINNIFYDNNYTLSDLNTAVDLCMQTDGIIVKPAVDSEGGHGIEIWEKAQGSESLKIILLKSNANVVIQSLIHQHPSLAAVHKESVNTIRMITFYHKGEVNVLSSILRFGIGDSRVDNASSGGWFCGIDECGKLKKWAYNLMGNRYEQHPDGLVFEGHEIIGFTQCIYEAKKLASRISRTCKLASWDFSVGDDGEPILIEVNMSYGELDFHQMTNGPLFKDFTDEVINEVFGSKRIRN